MTETTINALDILGGPPVPCRAKVMGSDAEVTVHAERDGRFLIVSVPASAAQAFATDFGAHSLDVILDDLGMVEHALRVKLAERMGGPDVWVCWSTVPAGSTGRATGTQQLGVISLTYAHRYISRTDRLCAKHGLELLPGEVAWWEMPSPGSLADSITHEIWRLSAVAGTRDFMVAATGDPLAALAALAAALEADNG